MKKNPLFTSFFSARVTALSIVGLLFAVSLKAQSLATWTMNSVDKFKPTLVAGNVVAGNFSVDKTFSTSSSAFTTSGFKFQPKKTWPSSIPTNDTFNVDYPISSKAGYDLTITGISFQVTTTITSGTTLLMTPFVQVDGKGSWLPVAASQPITDVTTTLNFTNLNQPLYDTHKYIVRFYITSTTSGTPNSVYFSAMNAVFSGSITNASKKPTVTILTATKSPSTPKIAGLATGKYDFASSLSNNGIKLVTQSGICWTTSASTPPDTSLASKTTDGSNGLINVAITGLNAGTTYYVRAYAVTQVDVIYSSTVLSFTTDAATLATLTTLSANSILSTRANTGGSIIDNGGASLTQEGVCWSTVQGTENISSGNNFTIDGVDNLTFSSLIKPLQPSTTYYVKAYAVNSVGVAYGNEISFTTAPPEATIKATPKTLSFPTVVKDGTSNTLSYTLTGNTLSPATDSIKITPPIGFSISTSFNSGFVTAPATLSVPYTNSTLNAQIFVKQITTSYGLNTGGIIHSGGGARTDNSDSVLVTANVVQDSNVLTNLGTDFWVGHGLEEHMGTNSEYGLQLYVATGAQGSTIKVSIPGIPDFTPQYYTIPANNVQIVSGFPTGDPNDKKNKAGLPDARLFYTGISNRGIHVEVTNNVPVALFLYDYATNNSAGGSMVFPTNTWNSSYIVQTYGGAPSNTGVPNTYFFVMAKEDNTVITFKPTAPIIDSASCPIISSTSNNPGTGGTIAYDVNNTTGYQVILNKGQVFNAIGLVDAGGIKKNGVSRDLTGTTVTSDCSHPISVFAGNSRTLINAPGLGCSPQSGSDNLIQQMFPKVAWGTKYLTVPTKSMEYNLFRIGVQDATTKVFVDGTILDKATLNSTGLFYEIEGNTCRKIESDKPINVTQFILPGKACGGAAIGNNGTGDPEMILLSPVQQAINSTTVYMSDFKDRKPGGTYINVIIPTSGVSSFRLDTALNPSQMVDTGTSSYSLDTVYGSATLIPIAKAFTPHPQDSTYSWAKFHVDYQTNPVHTLSSDIGFNAIAYGVADGESWGYNAGTAIRDLTAVFTTNTPFGKSSTPTTCRGNSTSLNISLPFDTSKVTSIQWVSSSDPSVSPANDTANGSIITTGSFVKDGITFYTYKSPKNYTFNNVGTYKFPITVYGTFTSDCGNSKTFDAIMTVVRDATDFDATPKTCGSATYNFTDKSIAATGDTLSKWQWAFNTPKNDSSYVQNPILTFPASGNYSVNLRSINKIGCFNDTVKTVKVIIAPPPVAEFGLPESACVSKANAIFVNKSDTAISGKLTYLWKFGDGGTSTTKDPTYTYNTFPPTMAGYTVDLIATSAAGCSDTATHILKIDTIPVVSKIVFSKSTDTLVTGEVVSVMDSVSNGVWESTTNPPLVKITSLGNSATVKALSNGIDTIRYILTNSCKADTANYPIVISTSTVFVPNLFTPGASTNNVFYIRGSSTLYPSIELWIFNSWGNLIFDKKGQIDDSNYGWDGNDTHNGKAQPSGTYIYVAKLNTLNGTITKKGTITLLR